MLLSVISPNYFKGTTKTQHNTYFEGKLFFVEQLPSNTGALLVKDYNKRRKLTMSDSASNKKIVPHHNDVLMGRGGKNNQHSGNEKLRDFARIECDNYQRSTKKGKSYISRSLVTKVRELNPPGRFLKRNQLTTLWEDVGDEIAREKASQVLRDAVSNQQQGLETESHQVPVTHKEWPRSISDGAIPPHPSVSTLCSYKSPTRGRALMEPSARFSSERIGTYECRGEGSIDHHERRYRSFSASASLGRASTPSMRQSPNEYYQRNEYRESITPVAMYQPQETSSPSQEEPIPFPPVTPISTSNRKRRRYFPNNASPSLPYESYNPNYSTQVQTPRMMETPQTTFVNDQMVSYTTYKTANVQEQSYQLYRSHQHHHHQQQYHQQQRQKQQHQYQQDRDLSRDYESSSSQRIARPRAVMSQSRSSTAGSSQSNSSLGLLGEMQENMGEFDLFDGELLDGKSSNTDKNLGYGSDPF